MGKHLDKLIKGYRNFSGGKNNSYIMKKLAEDGQQPKVMIIACSDSRVDPAILFQCNPGDIFVVRNVANIVPPYENDEFHHGTSSAIEYAVKYLNVEDIIIIGHSDCGGIKAKLNNLDSNDFLNKWLDLINIEDSSNSVDSCSKSSLLSSYKNCLTYPWIVDKINNNELNIHLWFVDIIKSKIYSYDNNKKIFSFV